MNNPLHDKIQELQEAANAHPVPPVISDKICELVRMVANDGKPAPAPKPTAAPAKAPSEAKKKRH